MNSSSTHNALSRAARVAVLAVAAALATGCAVTNHDFASVAGLSGDARLEQLVDDLAATPKGDDALYDAFYVPLTHLDLHVFTESDDDEYPRGYAEADIETYLPLLSLIDAKVDRYDEDLEVIETHQFNALFWGLFAYHHNEVMTSRGLRSMTHYRLLWLIGWNTGPKYSDA